VPTTNSSNKQESKFKLLASIKGAFETLQKSNFILLLRLYFKKRKISFLILIFSLILICLLFANIHNYYRPVPTPETSLSVSSYGSYRISRVQLEIKYTPDGKDIIKTSTFFNRKEETINQSGLILYHSNNLAPSKLDDLSNGINDSFYKEEYKIVYFNFKQKEEFGLPMVAQEFEGNIFKVTAQDLSLNFRFSNSSTDEDFPVDIYISGIPDLNITSVQPEPTKRLQLAFYYHFDSIKDENLIGGIYFNATDRFKTYNVGFMLFFIGTLIGVLISIVVTLLLDIVKHLEENMVVNK
jgi:hypothetical protein